MSKISVRFLIDKEQKRVIFAEAGSDFVDVLLSFLTLPLGRIVKLLNKQSDFGSLDGLYKSVEKLDTLLFQTKACKEMLLNPRSASAELCEDLKIKNIHDLKPRSYFTCYENNCSVLSTNYYTYTKYSQCSLCGNMMYQSWDWKKKTSDEGVFVKENYDFMISHDLRIIPASVTSCCSLLAELQIKDASILEERVIDFETEEALNLLQRSLVSKNALTEVCFPEASMQANMDCCSLPIKEEMVVNEAEHNIILKLFLNKKNNDVLFAEVGEEFVNYLMSLLTFPLGSVFRFLPENISFGGCIINLYKSVEIIGLNYFKSEICRNMLLAPKLPTFYGLKNQFLEMEEITSNKWILLNSCSKCYMDNGYKLCTSLSCIHGMQQAEFIEQNPKSSKGVIDDGEVFVVSPKRFMVADNLHISPSLISIISYGNKLPLSDLVTVEVSMDKDKARLLLGAMLNSQTVLTDVFMPK